MPGPEFYVAGRLAAWGILEGPLSGSVAGMVAAARQAPRGNRLGPLVEASQQFARQDGDLARATQRAMAVGVDDLQRELGLSPWLLPAAAVELNTRWLVAQARRPLYITIINDVALGAASAEWLADGRAESAGGAMFDRGAQAIGEARGLVAVPRSLGPACEFCRIFLDPNYRPVRLPPFHTSCDCFADYVPSG